MDLTVRACVDAHPDGRDGDAGRQRFHGMATQVGEDHGCGGSVLDHVLSDGGQICAPTTNEDDFLERIVLVEFVFSLDAVIEKDQS